jgi:N6-adenosine-specific RNA methylase IME4
MPLDEIKALPVQSIAEDDCALLMWVTNPLLPEGLEVIKAWGFAFKTVCFNWLKKTRLGNIYRSLGHYTMASTELCFLATRGRPKPLRRDIEQFVSAVRHGHNQKPDEVRKRNRIAVWRTTN